MTFEMASTEDMKPKATLKATANLPNPLLITFSKSKYEMKNEGRLFASRGW